MMAADLTTLAWTHAGALVNRSWTLPIVAISPTSRCHSRCVSCDWWRTAGTGELSLDEYERLAADLSPLGTRLVVMTGGEPLLRDDLWAIARVFAARGIVLHLLTSGLALRAHAADVARYCAQVVISLDAASADQYVDIRGVDGWAAVERGLARLREVGPRVRVTARATLHKRNFRQLPDLIATARRFGVDRLSFLAADLTSAAFGPRDHAAIGAGLALSAEEVDEFRCVVEHTLAECSEAFTSGFVAESPDKLRRLPEHYAAHLGHRPFPPIRCNAPAVSVAVDADGSVRPCFYHAPIGNVRRTSLREIVTTHLPTFRASWRPAEHPICQRCVCALNVGWGRPPWA